MNKALISFLAILFSLSAQGSVSDDKILLIAVKTGNKDLVEAMISKGADTSQLDSANNTLVHIASRSGIHHIIETLVNSGIDIDAFNDDGFTALHLAAQTNITASKALIELGASVDILATNGCTPLLCATYGPAEHPDTIIALIEAGANVAFADSLGQNTLHHAAINNKPKTILTLLDHGFDINAPSLSGATPLIIAAQNDARGSYQTLLTQGADPARTDSSGKTAAQYL